MRNQDRELTTNVTITTFCLLLSSALGACAFDLKTSKSFSSTGASGGSSPSGAGKSTSYQVFGPPSYYVAPEGEVPAPTHCRVEPRIIVRQHEGGGRYGDDFIASSHTRDQFEAAHALVTTEEAPCPKKASGELGALIEGCSVCLSMDWAPRSRWVVEHDFENKPVSKYRVARVVMNATPGATAPDAEALRKKLLERLPGDFAANAFDFPLHMVILTTKKKISTRLGESPRMFLTASAEIEDLALSKHQTSSVPGSEAVVPRKRMSCEMMYELRPVAETVEIAGPPRCSQSFGQDGARFEDGVPCSFDETSCTVRPID